MIWNTGHFSVSSSVLSLCDLLKPPGLALAMETWNRVVGTSQAGVLGTQPNLEEARSRHEQTHARETGLIGCMLLSVFHSYEAGILKPVGLRTPFLLLKTKDFKELLFIMG